MTTITNKQHFILTLVQQGNSDGTAVDFDQIMERIPWETTKESMQFTFRSMIKKRLIEKGELELRRRARRRVYKIMPGGLYMLREVPPPYDPERYFEHLKAVRNMRSELGKSESEVPQLV